MEDDRLNDPRLAAAPVALLRTWLAQLVMRARTEGRTMSALDWETELDCVAMTTQLLNYLVKAEGWSPTLLADEAVHPRPSAGDVTAAFDRFDALGFVTRRECVSMLRKYAENLPMFASVRKLARQVLVGARD